MAKAKKPQVGVPDAGRNNMPIILAAIAVVVVLAAVALIASKPWDSDKNDDGVEKVEFQSVAVTGSPLPAEYSDAEGKNLNEAKETQAPSLVGKNFTSQPVNIAAGKPKVIMFFAHWCPHCQAEIPKLSKWLRTNASKYPSVEFYGVSTASNPQQSNFPPSAWFKREKFPSPVLVDNRNSDAAKAYGLGSYPYIVILDKDNKVITRTSGEISMDDFEGLVKRAVPAG